MNIVDLMTRLQRHIAQMAPHQKVREQAVLLVESEKAIREYLLKGCIADSAQTLIDNATDEGFIAVNETDFNQLKTDLQAFNRWKELVK